jgi:hypothetical protein
MNCKSVIWKGLTLAHIGWNVMLSIFEMERHERLM